MCGGDGDGYAGNQLLFYGTPKNAAAFGVGCAEKFDVHD